MSLALLQSVKQAEARAEEILQKAQQDAREIIKSAEEACAEKKQLAVKEHRALLARELENARSVAAEKIQKQAREQGQGREISKKKAREKLPKAADLIMERVVYDVHH